VDLPGIDCDTHVLDPVRAEQVEGCGGGKARFERELQVRAGWILMPRLTAVGKVTMVMKAPASSFPTTGPNTPCGPQGDRA
jgi:hypothetical protein